MKVNSYFIWVCCFLACFSLRSQTSSAQLLVIGGGASGTAAAIQASRSGINTIIIEKTPWLGGMLTAAGVSAIDGNHNMPSGIWGEFRSELYDYYGGPKAVETGWVSNTLFEPSVGNEILQKMAGNPDLKIMFETEFKNIRREGEEWIVTAKKGRKEIQITAQIVIDGTELGDVAAALKIPYSIGMDSKEMTAESIAPAESNNIIQDLTYVATLKDYGEGKDMTIKMPVNYSPAEFECACDINDPKGTTAKGSSCWTMLQYGRLPNNKYMINWPNCGNDYYLNLIEEGTEKREVLYEEAKQQTLRFIYFIQDELGFRNLGLAKNEYPTKDDLPMIPYHRESRRIHGKVRLTAEHMKSPFDQDKPLYRTGIAVGDYPIDHHHDKNDNAPEIDFINYKIPSYNVPIGALIPETHDNIIIAEKSISVSNIANGATRLQPVVLGIGQAAGAIATIAIQNGVSTKEINIRKVQELLVNSSAYIIPYYDIKPENPHFELIQKIGATGILRGTGIPYKWANQTWFYPDQPISQYKLLIGLKDIYPQLHSEHGSGELITLGKLIEWMKLIDSDIESTTLPEEVKDLKNNSVLTRLEVALIINHYLDPFNIEIDFKGKINPNN
ncbi:FAD-dependent oxidoreductase [Mangrovivirga cuniculi]|uniref:FAD-dependent oxidoreductase n=1 Tax=Mangrovivirga cuniculi TaxID=2715131 RepID=A0A4D7JME0_9BACT|nr:FAD-dependent oxidoreductase [Mangrovivirga cuniculi]QCK16761.1 FAD-dependent oxidoreductase [Mangrovivirga cuniculi]